jgi:FixJ family two-component response regulator
MIGVGDGSCDNTHRIPPPTSPLSRLTSPLIAIVDDDDSVRQALTGLVRSLGYSGRAFASAEDFLAAADQSCDCIVSDLHMPGISGLDLLQRLRSDGDRTPLILITARMAPGLRDRAAEAGVKCLLPKPFAVEELVACINRALADGSACT